MDALGMKGKTAVVTGAAQGIGEATALALAEQGVNVAAIDTNEDLLPGLTDRLRQKGVQAQGLPQMYLTVRLSMISSLPLNVTWGLLKYWRTLRACCGRVRCNPSVMKIGIKHFLLIRPAYFMYRGLSAGT